ncbi:MAG: hypothetical protein V1659_01035 [Candidatus Woesearchaeota archaeon]
MNNTSRKVVSLAGILAGCYCAAHSVSSLDAPSEYNTPEAGALVEKGNRLRFESEQLARNMSFEMEIDDFAENADERRIILQRADSLAKEYQQWKNDPRVKSIQDYLGRQVPHYFGLVAGLFAALFSALSFHSALGKQR